mmetsp:Transcript_13549/g.40948  ORF Transcript_13549/g.40948 Transcript_13549/m.40948 type:complete len:288 (-) Transcript_13549:63-926(-)
MAAAARETDVRAPPPLRPGRTAVPRRVLRALRQAPPRARQEAARHRGALRLRPTRPHRPPQHQRQRRAPPRRRRATDHLRRSSDHGEGAGAAAGDQHGRPAAARAARAAAVPDREPRGRRRQRLQGGQRLAHAPAPARPRKGQGRRGTPLAGRPRKPPRHRQDRRRRREAAQGRGAKGRGRRGRHAPRPGEPPQRARRHRPLLQGKRDHVTHRHPRAPGPQRRGQDPRRPSASARHPSAAAAPAGGAPCGPAARRAHGDGLRSPLCIVLKKEASDFAPPRPPRACAV